MDAKPLMYLDPLSPSGRDRPTSSINARRYSVFLLLLFLFPQYRSTAMVPLVQSRLDYISADFLSAISNPAASIFVGRIRQVRPAPDLTQGGLTYHAGTLAIDVQESLAGSPPRPSVSLEVPFHQIADPMIRIRNLRDQWNNLTFAQSQILLLASVPSNTSGPHLIAAANLKSLEDPTLKSVRIALGIEHATPHDKPGSLSQALQSPDLTLLSYALNSLGERHVLGAEAGLRLMVDALTNPATPANNRKEIAYTLATGFDAAPNPQAQATIIAALAYVMVNDRDKEKQSSYASYLRACVASLKDVPAHRDSLLRTVHIPPPAQVVETLTALAHDAHTEPDRQERDSFAQLAEIWRMSSHANP